jgi:tetrahedral aminopeptidase
LKDETITEILLELSSSIGVSGSETAAVETAARYFRQYTENVKRDRFGNLLALLCGEPQTEGERLTIAVVAHIDEIGAMVTKIEPEGFLRFTPVGGIDPRTILGQTVVVSGKKPLKGVIGAAPPHLLSDQGA